MLVGDGHNKKRHGLVLELQTKVQVRENKHCKMMLQ
jgi:hypothetical protein